KRDRIGVTVLCPTFFKTRIAERARVHGAQDPKIGERLMARATLQADGVAKAALASVARGELYALPHRAGRRLWRRKRAAPRFFYDRIITEVLRGSRGARRVWIRRGPRCAIVSAAMGQRGETREPKEPREVEDLRETLEARAPERDAARPSKPAPPS